MSMVEIINDKQYLHLGYYEIVQTIFIENHFDYQFKLTVRLRYNLWLGGNAQLYLNVKNVTACYNLCDSQVKNMGCIWQADKVHVKYERWTNVVHKVEYIYVLYIGT